MKKICTIVALSMVMAHAYGQAVLPPNIRATNTLEKLFDLDGLGMGDMLYGIPLPEGRLVGDTYLNSVWNKSTLLLYEKEQLLEGYPIRYDIYADELEVKAKNGIKVLKGNKVKSFVWIDSATQKPGYFINARGFKNSDNVPATGFFEVLTEGNMPLLKKTFIDIKKADYNIQFNVGSHDDKIIKKNDFYALKGTQLVEIPSSKKKLAAIFEEQDEVIEQFMKENNLSATKEAHLKILFDHYNSLLNN